MILLYYDIIEQVLSVETKKRKKCLDGLTLRLPTKKCAFCTSGVKLTPVKNSYFTVVFAVLLFNFCLLSTYKIKKSFILVIMELLKPKRNETIVVEVAAAPSEHKFCSLLQG